MTALETFAAFAAGLRPEDLPARVRSKAGTCLLDAIWGCFHIHRDERARAALRIVPAGTGAHILTTHRRASPADAAFVNATACAATDRSDTHLPTATHPGIVIVPALLAVLEAQGGSGADLLRGLVVGYEVMGRIANAIVVPGFGEIYRTTAVTAPVAAAIAVATALRLDPAAIVAAGSLATHGSVGFNQWARDGTGEHVFHAGTAARHAVTCALLAAQDVVATPAALDGPSGLLAGFGALDRAAELGRGLGTAFVLDDVAFKPAPACFFAQTPAQVAATLGPLPAIEAIEVRVTRVAADFPGCAARDIGSAQAATMSIPFAVASTLRAGRIDPESWTDFANPAVAALASRCTVVADPALTARYPAQSGAALIIRCADGRTIERAHDDFRSMIRDEVIDRLRAEAGPATDRLLACADAMATLDDVAEIARLCARTGDGAV